MFLIVRHCRSFLMVFGELMEASEDRARQPFAPEESVLVDSSCYRRFCRFRFTLNRERRMAESRAERGIFFNGRPTR